ncbi:glycerophosphodiester phosphodiesterase [Aneurinibacillus aneurinilyticus]|jgi:glycerophosphoryl diester phosphodiesterase|uniref:Glycerophosphodiester phosphodiesterase n=2 Tax=Aneurinibacillus aneurinilyticus TaxID=1391 RepID=A0A848CU46_ANEAE|nr:glycerophosphodiester phosphodiesterase family protein [Aneurinibacillus aneurinilyticus]ERI10470.1 glycerophosphodiester phosphodiesterase family protein [Aneurinibacillus aneurinilyticus ATCC 12856]MED0669533.1 glycerophosphodiester phosphodiesterase family protein [Aneurinibacillus aneurinilyticus]MED0709101.1 glycerophosphodiester phosphodiesterase family protein [Aneurinibacillus aneurinilyticus]MED0725495.1 glycerophosphodiester phosphodiesterase family protein [Aneurinibacillus aneuri
MNNMFLIYAHRGSSIRFPENTLPAFTRAIKDGANGIELDVQLTRDEQIVVFHDWTLQRITGRRGKISDYTLKQLRTMDFGIWKHTTFAGVRIPTLEQVFKQFTGKNIMINIELKNFFAMRNGLEKKVVELIRLHNMEKQVTISTFNPFSLELLHKNGCASDIAFLYFGRLKEPWKYAKEYACTYIHPPIQEITEELLLSCGEQGLKVVPYQVNTLAEIKKMIDLGTDGIITPRPALAYRLLHGTPERKQKRKRP